MRAMDQADADAPCIRGRVDRAVNAGACTRAGRASRNHRSGSRGPLPDSSPSPPAPRADHRTEPSVEPSFFTPHGVKILGIDTESLALTIVAVVASLLLALAVWLTRWPRLILLLVAGFGLVFAAGEGRELVHQLDESNAGIAVIAAILIGRHLAVAALAATLFLHSADADRSAAAELAT
jgi:hypothetical protein